MGLKDSAIDTLVDTVIAAKTRDELVTATRALDRALWFHHFIVPNWYMAAHRVSWWNKFGQPTEKPLQYSPIDFMVRYEWLDPQLEASLKAAMKDNKSL